MAQYFSYLNNKEVISEFNYQILSPENKEVIGNIYQISRSQLPSFFTEAEKAFQTYRKSSFASRKKILTEWRKQICNNFDFIVDLIVKSIAKTKIEAAKEVNDALSFIEEVVNFAYFQQPRFYNCDKSGINKIAYYQRLPHGIVLCINPFNYPVSSCMFKMAPALITGNTVIFKSATQSSIVVSFLFKLLAKTSIPLGVASFIACQGKELGNDLVNNRKIKIINFTGSTKVGLNIKKLNHWAKLLLELGGNDIGIVLRDCNLQNTVKEIMTGAFRYNGQRCTAIKRLIIEDSIYNECLQQLKIAVRSLKVGRARDNADITALIDQSSCHRARNLVSDAIKQGAIVEVGNKVVGNLFSPTIISGVTPEMDLFCEEQFAPILPIYRGSNSDYHKFIEIANNSQYGLQGSIFTQDIDKAIKFANQVETGTININSAPAKGPNYLPFFGIKNSGCGSQGYEDILNFYTYEKGIIIKYV